MKKMTEARRNQALTRIIDRLKELLRININVFDREKSWEYTVTLFLTVKQNNA